MKKIYLLGFVAIAGVLFAGNAHALTLSGVKATNITSSGAQIQWTTDAPGTSQVSYGTSTAAMQSTGPSDCVASAGFVVAHCVNLAGLVSGTNYYYMAQSFDASGTMFSSGGSFTTANAADTQPPTAPGSITVSTTTNSVSVSWSASTDNVGVTGYKIYRNSAYLASINSLIYADSSVAPITPYTYYVVAFDAAGNVSAPSPTSIPVSVTGGGGGGDTQPPSQPTNLVAASPLLPNQVNLQWNPSTDNVGVAGYRVYRSANAGWSQVGSISTNAFTDNSVSPSSPYYYYVVAYDAAGNVSASSSPLFLNTPANSGDTQPPSQPTSFAATAFSSSQVNLSWAPSTDNVGVVGYKIYRNGAYVSYATGTTFADTGLNPSTSYAYNVVAYDAAGNASTWSATMSATTFAASGGGNTQPPSQPTNLVATSTWDKVDLAWTASTDNVGVAGYKVFRNGAFYMTIISNSFTDTAVTAQTPYSYFVKAYDAAGLESSSSASVSTWTLAVPPANTTSTPTSTVPLAPSNLVFNLSQGGTSVDLAWADNAANETQFVVYRQPQGGAWGVLATVGADITGYRDANVPAGVYYYQISACNTYCSGGSNVLAVAVGGNTNVPTDTTPPAVTSVTYTPANGGAQTKFTVQFSKSVNAQSVNSANVFLAPVDYPSYHVPGSFTIGDNSFDFTAPNLPNVPHVLTIRGIADLAGNTMATAYTSDKITISSPDHPTYPYPPGGTTGSSYPVSIAAYDSVGQAVSGVSVYIARDDLAMTKAGITGVDGTFSPSLPPGSYTAQIYTPQARTDLIQPAPMSFTVAGPDTPQVVFRFGALIKLLGGTVLFMDGNVVPDAKVFAYSLLSHQWIEGVTDDHGAFDIKIGRGAWRVGVKPLDPATAKWNWPGPPVDVAFRDDNTYETRSTGFVVQSLGAGLSVHAVDDAGAPVPDAGIMIDTVRAGAAAVSHAPAEFRKTDDEGVASFMLGGGKYYVRGFVPGNRGYFNPEEQPLQLAAGDAKDIMLIFRKIANVATVRINGVTRTDSGSSIDAYVWAWSDTGGARSTQAVRGKFSLVLNRDESWHIGAAQNVDGYAYKASEIMLDAASPPDLLELILAKIVSAPVPPKVTVTQSATQEIIAQTNDGAHIALPPDALATGGNVKVDMKPTSNAPSQPAARAIGTVYDISATDAAGNPVKTLARDSEIVLPYNDDALAAQGLTPESLSPSYFDEGTGSWVHITDYVIDKEKHVIVFRVNHLTRFAIVAPADTTPPDPPTNATAKATGIGAVLLSWTNPPKDFSHAKVYRSTDKNSLGILILNDAAVSKFTDSQDLSSGRMYYYTIRAVDPAGNESANSNQVTAKVVGVAFKGFVRDLKLGSRGADVTLLQTVLVREGVLDPEFVSGYFGLKTQAAVIKFQNKYKAILLAPVGLTKGSGYVGARTRTKLTELAR